MRRGERMERCQLDDRFRLAFEQDGKNDDVLRSGHAKARVDAGVAGWNLRQENALLFERALADEALPHFNPSRLIVANGITGEQ